MFGPMSATKRESHPEKTSPEDGPEGAMGRFIEENDGHACPAGSNIPVKHIAYLYAYCRKQPVDIVGRYPKTLSLAQVHAALAHYYTHRDAFDAEIARDGELNAPDVLAGPAVTLPGLGLRSLLEAVEK
jgi:uncharacterized protein (DUF433 family)